MKSKKQFSSVGKKEMKLKAWMVYLIVVFVVGFPGTLLLVNLGYGTGEGISYDMGSMFGTSVIVGGGILLIYYAIKSSRKKKK